jgi:hypothetical protein
MFLRIASFEQYFKSEAYSSKHFLKGILTKIFPRLLSLRKYFCNNKNISNKLFYKNNGKISFYYDIGLVFLKRNIFQLKSLYQTFFQGYYL